MDGSYRNGGLVDSINDDLVCEVKKESLDLAS